MRRPAPTAARSLFVVVAVALAVTMSGCVPEPAPTTTATATATSTPTPTPTPTPTGEPVAPGAQPPAVFGGECAAALASTDIDDVVGADMTPYATDTDASIANVGGLNCMWTGTDAALTVSILPRAGIGDAQLPAGAVRQFFQDCDPTLSCSWQWNEGDLWIAGTFQFVAGMTQAKVTAWGQDLGDAIAANHAAQPGAPWVRDKADWWQVRECSAVASAVAKELGGTVKGAAATYPDPPAPGVAMADIASNRTWCELTVPGTSTPLTLNLFAGEAWYVREGEGDKAFDTKVAGITGFRLAAYDGSPSNSFSFTDGVNRVRIDVPADAKASVGDIARAVARAAASGF
jgi:hypothetical protein